MPHHSHRRMKKNEVSDILDQLSSEERSERVWKDMISEAHDSSEPFEPVEEHLLDRPHESNHNLRRWKFFGK